MYNSQNIYVFAYGDWMQEGLSSGVFSDITFREAATNAERIHFNLEGIQGDPVDYSERYGNNGRLAGSSSFPATELYIIRKENYCRKTTFWDNGSTFPTINSIASQRICSE